MTLVGVVDSVQAPLDFTDLLVLECDNFLSDVSQRVGPHWVDTSDTYQQWVKTACVDRRRYCEHCRFPSALRGQHLTVKLL